MINNQNTNENQTNEEISEEIIDKDIVVTNDETNDNDKNVNTSSEQEEPDNIKNDNNILEAQSQLNYLNPNILDVKTYSYDELEKFNNEENEEDESYSANLIEVNEREVTKGTVVGINEKGILVDIGFKSEGVIERSEFSKLPKVGDEVDAFVVCFEDRRGRLILSKERADFEKRWSQLRSAFSEETLINGKIIKRIKGGMVVDLGVVNAFLPGSQIDVKAVTDFDEYVGHEFDFKIVKFNEFRQNIVVSRKATMSSFDKSRQEMLSNIEVGSTQNGVVKNITDFGAFIDLGGVDGLLHITDITWGRINHPKEKLSIGDNIDVKIIDYDEEKHRISLGLKQLQGDPWSSVADKYTIDSVVEGKIVNIMNYGIFLELEEGIEGLVHISEISWTKHIKHPSDMYKVGDKLEASILSVDTSQKKISLGIKQLSDNPWLKIEDDFKTDDICKGKVVNIVQTGVYVEIGSGIEGFLHNNDISWTRKIKSAAEIFNINDEIETKILDVSIENKKIFLGYKQLAENKWLNISEYINVGEVLETTIIHKFEKGLILLLPNDFEGLLPQSKISNKESDYKINDKISVLVEEIDVEQQKIILNCKDNSDIDNNNVDQSIETSTEDNAEDTEIFNEVDNSALEKEIPKDEEELEKVDNPLEEENNQKE